MLARHTTTSESTIRTLDGQHLEVDILLERIGRPLHSPRAFTNAQNYEVTKDTSVYTVFFSRLMKVKYCYGSPTLSLLNSRRYQFKSDSRRVTSTIRSIGSQLVWQTRATSYCRGRAMISLTGMLLLGLRFQEVRCRPHLEIFPSADMD